MRILDALARPRVFLMAVAGYYALALAIRTLLLSGSSGDEAQLMLYGQGFALGYDLGNPPLAGWLATIVEAVTGPSLGGAIFLRYALLTATFGFTLAAAREVIEDRRLALAAALSPIAFWFLGWDALTRYMDSLVLIAALMGTVWLMLRLARQPSPLAYAGLAIAMAAGALGKYSYPPALLLALIVALIEPGLRRAVLDWRFFTALLAAAALAAPAYGWVIEREEAWLAMAASRIVHSPAAEAAPATLLERLWLTPKAALAFSLPLLPLFLVVFGRALWLGRCDIRSEAGRRVVRWLGFWLGLMLVAMTVGVMASGMEKLREHYLFLLIPLPILLFALLPAGRVRPRHLMIYTGLLGGLAVTALGALAAQAVIQPERCSKCRLIMPWETYAIALRDAGFKRGTIISFDSPSTDAGVNLRRFLPETRVRTNKRPDVDPPPLDRPGDCLVVWNNDRYAYTADWIRANPIMELGGPVPDNARFGVLEAPLAGGDRVAPRLGYALIEGGVAACR